LAHFEEIVLEARKLAGKRNFPDLLALVNNGLQDRLTFEDEFLSLQKVRNCLEHRGGRVTEQDIDPVTGVLSLCFPILKVFFKAESEEIEMLTGESFDTHQINADLSVPRSIYVRRDVRERIYALHDPVMIGARDFFEIALACQMFASDLATRLPGVSVKEV